MTKYFNNKKLKYFYNKKRTPLNAQKENKRIDKRMPCQLCNDTAHALKNCDSERRQQIIREVTEYELSHKLDMEIQSEFLQKYKIAELKMVCWHLHTYAQGNKTMLIANIIGKMFTRRVYQSEMLGGDEILGNEEMTNRILSRLSEDDLDTIDRQYMNKNEYMQNASREVSLNIISSKIWYTTKAFYKICYGINRKGVSKELYMEAVGLMRHTNNIVQAVTIYENREGEKCVRVNWEYDDIGYFIEIKMERIGQLTRILRNHPERFISQQMAIINREHSSSSTSHLKKLEIAMSIIGCMDETECAVCLDKKEIMRLGCSHEYCEECIVGIAKSRTKSFINCPLCRSEVTEIQVASEERKRYLLQELMAV